MKRFLWAFVAFRAAWRIYPKATTVLPNAVISVLLQDAGYEQQANAVWVSR